MTTEEKKTAIQDYLLGNKFTVTSENDEFTGYKSRFIQTKESIMYSDKFVDTGIEDIQESMKDFLRAKVDMSFEEARKKLSADARPYLATFDREEYYEEEIERVRKVAVTRSAITGTLGYSEDSDENENHILLNVCFSNVSHHRDVKGMKVYVKKNSGDTICLSNIYAISPVEKKTELYEITREIEYLDYVSFSMNEKEIEFFTDKCEYEAYDFSARFDGMQIPGKLYLTKEEFAYLKFLISKEEVTESQVDSLYESVQEAIRLDKELEEHSIKFDKKSKAKDEANKYIDKLKKEDFNRFDYASLLASGSDKLPYVKKIKKICKENDLQSSVLDFLEAIPKKYDTQFIINDVDEKSKLREHYNVVKTVMNISGWIMLILLIVFTSEGTDAGMGITIILGGLFFGLKKYFKNKDVYFHEKTSQLIEDFKNALNGSKIDFDI